MTFKMTFKKIFNLISYLRIPFYLWGIYFFVAFLKVVQTGHSGWEQLNNFLVLTGIGLAFSSLKEPSRTHNFISKRIWKNEIAGIFVIILISILIIGLIILGLSTMFFSKTYRSEAIAVGMIVLGIGLIGNLKYTVERLKNKHPQQNK